MSHFTTATRATARLTLAALFVGTLGPVCPGQVFDESPTAGPGQAYYANWGLMPDAENPAPNSYNEYRKSTDGGAVADPLVTATNDDDGSTATLNDLSQGGGGALRAAGMFFGESPSTSSYADTLLQFGSINRPDAGTRGDTNNRTSWDLRFGFTESPDDWIAGKEPNVEAWDMWTGDHGSDTVYMQVEVGATNDPTQSPIEDNPDTSEVDEATNVFLGITRAVVGQSGNETLLANEQGRNQWRGVDSADPLQTENTLAFMAPELERISTGESLEITAVGSHYDTGVGYDDLTGIQWRMELNDPDNPDPDLARQVNFILEAGDVRYSQVFDPGDAENPVEPNFTNDAFNVFTDGFFDWENAYPIFFVGASGGSLLSTTGVIGFESMGGGDGVAGDYNNNGTVEQADLDLVLLNWGQDGSTPPEGWTNNLPEGNIDQAELDGVLLNWGNTAAMGAASAIPEPGSALLLLLGLAGLLAARHHSPRR